MTKLVKLIKDAVVIPLAGSMSSFTGGVFNSARHFVEDSINERGKPPVYESPKDVITEPCIYGGCLFGHFGHFIWESLSRLSIFRECKPLPLIFISPNPGIQNGQVKIFRAIGIKNAIILIKKPTLFKNLLYGSPQSGVNPLFLTEIQQKSLACINVGNKQTGKKIWLSRTQISTGKILNESEIESQIINFGYEIIHPETLEFHTQIKLIATSKIISGFDGSQFFTFMFAKKVLSRFIIFNRRPIPTPALPLALTMKNLSYQMNIFPVELCNGDPESAGANYRTLGMEKIVRLLCNA